MSESTTTQDQQPEIRNPFTVEAGLYIGIVLFALVVRLYRLGLAPLSTPEAQLALAAWRGAVPPAGASPALTWLNALLFALFESSDALARLWPALIGTALVALPALLRDRLGRAGALGAAAVLAISPVAIMTSRTASGDGLAAAVMLGLVAVCVRYLDDRRAHWLYAGALLAGLGLASGPLIYSALVTLAVCVAAAFNSAQARERWRFIRNTPGLFKQALIVFAAALLACATAFAWKPNGLGSTVELLSAWVAGFSSVVLNAVREAPNAVRSAPNAGASWVWPFQVLAVYEVLTVIGGVIGLVMVLQQRWARSEERSTQRNYWATSLMAWLVTALALVVARAGRGNGDVLLVVLPLALLSGYAFQALADSRVANGNAARFTIKEGALILILLTVMAYFVLGLAGYAANSGAAPASAPFNLGPAAQLVQSLLAVTLAAVVLALFATLCGIEVAVRGLTLALLIAFALMTWSAGWGAAQIRPGDPREIIAGPEMTSLDVRDLTRDLARLSADQTTDATALPLAVQGAPDGVLGWYLRDMQNARFVPGLEGPAALRASATMPAAFITTDGVREAPNAPPALSAEGQPSYAGQRYILQHAWQFESKTANDMLKWLIYRKADIPKPTQQINLWVKQGP